MENIDSLGILVLSLLFGWTVHLAPAFIIRFLLFKKQSTITWAILICMAHIFVITAIRFAFSSKMGGGDHLATFLYFTILRFNEKSADFIKNNKLIISCSYVVFLLIIGYVLNNNMADYRQLASKYIDNEKNKVSENNIINNDVKTFVEQLLDYYIKNYDSLDDELKDPERFARYFYDQSGDKNKMSYETWTIYHGIYKFIKEATDIRESKNTHLPHQDGEQQDTNFAESPEQQWIAAQQRFIQKNPEFAQGDLNRLYIDEINYIITTPQAKEMSDDEVLDLAKINVENKHNIIKKNQMDEILRQEWLAAQQKFFDRNPMYFKDDLYNMYVDEVNKITANSEYNSLTNEQVLDLAKSKVDEMLRVSKKVKKKQAPVKKHQSINCGEGFVATAEGGCKPQ